MSNFEWFLLVGVVIVVPLLVAIVVTLWTLEMARQRKRSNRPGAAAMVGVKRNASKPAASIEGASDTSMPETVVKSTSTVAGEAGVSPDGVDVPAEGAKGPRASGEARDGNSTRGTMI